MTEPKAVSSQFLPRAYEARLESLAEIGEGLEPRPSSGVSVNAQLGSLALKMIRHNTLQNRFVRREQRRMPSNVNSMQDLEKILQLDGYAAVVIHTLMDYQVSMAALMAGNVIANDESAVPRSYEIGEEMILLGARHAVSTLLRSSHFLFRADEKIRPGGSVWSQSQQLHDSDNVKSGPKIVSGAWERFRELRDQSFETEEAKLRVKASRSQALILFRALKTQGVSIKKAQKASPAELLEIERESSLLFFQTDREPLELDQRTIVHTVGTITSTMKWIKNAGRHDPAIAQDPATRYVAFMLNRIGGYTAINSQRAAFKRRSRQIAEQLRQFQ